MHLAPYSEVRGAQLCQQECKHQEQGNGMVETWPCPQPCAPPGAWPRPPRSLGAAPCRGPTAKSSLTAGGLPMPAAPGRKLKHGAGVTRALPRPNATAPGCGESGPQQLDQPSEQPCHWGGPRREEPPGGDQQKEQLPAGTGTSAAICYEAALPPGGHGAPFLFFAVFFVFCLFIFCFFVLCFFVLFFGLLCLS